MFKIVLKIYYNYLTKDIAYQNLKNLKIYVGLNTSSRKLVFCNKYHLLIKGPKSNKIVK